MKKLTGSSVFERSLLVIMALLLVLVCFTGGWVYNRLSQITDREQPNDNQVSRRSLVADLNNNLLKADNLTYTFLFEGNYIAQFQFDGLKERTFDKLSGLHAFRKEDKPYQKQVEELILLIEQRFENQEALMAIQNENRVDETMNLVFDEVKNTKTPLPVQEPKPAAEEKRRLFKKKKEKEAEKPVVNPLLIAEQNKRQINSNLRFVQEQVVSKEDSENALKLELEQSNNMLSKKINERFRMIVLADKLDLERETAQAKEAAKETNQIILLFLLISVLLMTFMTWLMVTLFRKTRLANSHLLAAKEKSDQLTEVKSRFLATMSHEIRTPLNAISGFSDQLFYEKLSDSNHHKVDIIRSSARHLEQITNEVLDLSRLERDHIQLEQIPFNLKKELISVKEQFGFQLEQRKNHIEFEGELKDWVVNGDPLRFRQMLINLIGNANKFSENSPIILQVKWKETKDNLELTISVKDNGIGIPKNRLQNIFEPFEQADGSVARRFGGTGLGLSITRLIVEKMDGSISVKSQEGKGTSFTIKLTLPFSETLVKEPTKTKTDFSFLHDKTILLVDDEPFNRLLLRSIFDGVKMNLLEAGNGVEAFELIKNNNIDIVLLDVQMPEMDGNELVAKISEHNAHEDLVVVGLTAALDDTTRKKMLLEGWTEVLTKPLDPEELSEVLHRLTDNAQPKNTMDQTNFDSLKKLCNNNPNIYKDLLETFITSTENGKIVLQELLKAQNWKQIGEKAHQLSSPFKHVDAMKCYSTLKEIERMGKDEADPAKIRKLIETFMEDSESVIEQTQQEINTLQ